MHWQEGQPIYLQLKEKITAYILAGSFPENEALPSIRQVSSEYRLNPLTVSKAYQALVELNIIEKRRGLGMFVSRGARARLLALERKHFLKKQWPSILKKIEYLGLTVEELL